MIEKSKLSEIHSGTTSMESSENMPPPPTYTGASSTTRFACMCMSQFDKLRFIRFNDQELQAIRTTISTSWYKGIQAEQNYYGSYEFKLKGNPWSGQGSEAVPARQMVCALFETLYNLGWLAVTATDVSKKALDKDTTMFRYQYPPPPPCDWMAISFNQGDRLRLINPPLDDGKNTSGVIEDMKQALGSMIKKDGKFNLLIHIQTEFTFYPDWKEQGAYEIKFRGYPWYTSKGSEVIGTRMMLLQMLEVLENNGFTLYLSIDQSTGASSETTSDTDSWYCRRLKTWKKGEPVYHSVPS
ncbi:hypothetical protein K435DRAFT_724898 [Dendrothele bispora CBS 962.96]|uniref:Uncharacterized protein n=1 Tax=Dendrothele bispora (strain CBS 962.96) TaxID=1314807 RepID=A0A4S8L3P2_DENBC|nr:hypothetical protein K435DRAFT_734214 [Dendrothele bispora CBS 962.96]THU93942.1 hypothetical protein K435DRAFT_724898 [Dendrothele bispora CBS 962.96]